MKDKPVMGGPVPTVNMTKAGQNAVVNAADQAQWEAQGWTLGKAKAQEANPGPQDLDGGKTQAEADTLPGGQPSGPSVPEKAQPSPAALALMQKHAVDPSLVKGTGKNGAITKADVEAYLEAN